MLAKRPLAVYKIVELEYHWMRAGRSHVVLAESQPRGQQRAHVCARQRQDHAARKAIADEPARIRSAQPLASGSIIIYWMPFCR